MAAAPSQNMLKVEQNTSDKAEPHVSSTLKNGACNDESNSGDNMVVNNVKSPNHGPNGANDNMTMESYQDGGPPLTRPNAAPTTGDSLAFGDRERPDYGAYGQANSGPPMEDYRANQEQPHGYGYPPNKPPYHPGMMPHHGQVNDAQKYPVYPQQHMQPGMGVRGPSPHQRTMPNYPQNGNGQVVNRFMPGPNQQPPGPTPTLNQLLQSPNPLHRFQNSYSDYSASAMHKDAYPGWQQPGRPYNQVSAPMFRPPVGSPQGAGSPQMDQGPVSSPKRPPSAGCPPQQPMYPQQQRGSPYGHLQSQKSGYPPQPSSQQSLPPQMHPQYVSPGGSPLGANPSRETPPPQQQHHRAPTPMDAQGCADESNSSDASLAHRSSTPNRGVAAASPSRSMSPRPPSTPHSDIPQSAHFSPGGPQQPPSQSPYNAPPQQQQSPQPPVKSSSPGMNYPPHGYSPVHNSMYGPPMRHHLMSSGQQQQMPPGQAQHMFYGPRPPSAYHPQPYPPQQQQQPPPQHNQPSYYGNSAGGGGMMPPPSQYHSAQKNAPIPPHQGGGGGVPLVGPPQPGMMQHPSGQQLPPPQQQQQQQSPMTRPPVYLRQHLQQKLYGYPPQSMTPPNQDSQQRNAGSASPQHGLPPVGDPHLGSSYPPSTPNSNSMSPSSVERPPVAAAIMDEASQASNASASSSLTDDQHASQQSTGSGSELGPKSRMPPPSPASFHDDYDSSHSQQATSSSQQHSNSSPSPSGVPPQQHPGMLQQQQQQPPPPWSHHTGGPMPHARAMNSHHHMMPPYEQHMMKRPDGLMKLYEMSDEPDRRIFLDRLVMFNEERGTPITQCPTISKQPLDLFRLYLFVRERGGFVQVTQNKTWKDVAGLLGIGASSSAAYTLRKQYMKHVLPFECKYDRGGIDPQPIINQLEAGTRKKNQKNAPAEYQGSGTGAPAEYHQGGGYPPGYEQQQQQQQQQQHYPPPPHGPMGIPGQHPPYHHGDEGQPPTHYPGYHGGPPPGVYSHQGPHYPVEQGYPPNQQGPPPSQHHGAPYRMPYSNGPVPEVPSNGPFPPKASGPPFSHQPPFSGSEVSRYEQQSQNSITPHQQLTASPASPMHQQQQQQQQQPGAPQPPTTPLSRPPSATSLQQQPPEASGTSSPAPGGTQPAPYSSPAAIESQQQPSPAAPTPPPSSVYSSRPSPTPPLSEQNNCQNYPGGAYPPGGKVMRPIDPHPKRHPDFIKQEPFQSAPYPPGSPYGDRGGFGRPPSASGAPVIPPWAQNHHGPNPTYPPRPGPYPGSSFNAAPGGENRSLWPPPQSATPASDHQQNVPPWAAQTSPKLGGATFTGRVSAPTPFGAATPQQQQQPHPAMMMAVAKSGALPMGGAPIRRMMDPAATGPTALFPPDSVEAVTPVMAKRRRMYARDVSPVEAWRLLMSLKSGLLAESTWALDVLQVLLFDDTTVLYFGLSHLPGLLEVLLEHYRRCLSAMYSNIADDVEIAPEEQRPLEQEHEDDEVSRPWYALARDVANRTTPPTILHVDYRDKTEVLVGCANLTHRSRDGKSVVYREATSLHLIDPERRWDIYEGFHSGYDHWQMGGGDITSHIATHFENDEKNVRFVRRMRDSKKESGRGSSVDAALCGDGDVTKTEEESTDDDATTVGPPDAPSRRPPPPIAPQSTTTTTTTSTVDGSGESRKRLHKDDEEEEAYTRDEPSLCIVDEAHESLARRACTISTIIRNLSFVPTNDAEMSKHSGLLLILGRMLLLHHTHLPRSTTTTTSSTTSDALSSLNAASTTINELVASDEQCSSLNAQKEWWWDSLQLLRENTLVCLANMASQLDLSAYPEEITLPILDGLLHWVVCPSAVARDPLPSLPPHASITPQRLALETLSKLSVLEGNVDLMLATPPWPRIDRLFAQLSRWLARGEDQTLREFSVVLLSNLCPADSSIARAIALHTSIVSHLIAFVEQAEQSALQVANSQGINALRENPELMGTTLDMVRRSAGTLRLLARVPDNRSLFVQQQQRLLALVMSQILDQGVAAIIADVLYECSLAPMPTEFTTTNTSAATTTTAAAAAATVVDAPATPAAAATGDTPSANQSEPTEETTTTAAEDEEHAKRDLDSSEVKTDDEKQEDKKSEVVEEEEERKDEEMSEGVDDVVSSCNGGSTTTTSDVALVKDTCVAASVVAS